MKILQDPSKFTFTNHFNQSLLKSRIEMMNRRKSPWMAAIKYGIFIGMLWVCAAFTKPYRAEVAAKIVEKVPELEAVLQPKVIEKPALNDFVWEKQSTTVKLVSKTKYVVYKDNKLYWVVTSKVTLKDINAIQREFEKVGGVFFVKQMKYDPLGYYLSEISIRTSFLKGGDICATDDLKAIEKPIPAFGGWISISGKNCGIADASYEPFFNKLVENEKRDVEKWIREHLIEYFKAFQKAKEEVNEKKNSQLKTFKGRFYTHPFKAPNGFAEFRKDALQYLCETGARNRVYFEGKTLRVENIYKSSEFLIDSHMSTLQEAESLTIDKIIAVACFVVYTDSTRRTAERTVAIFTNASPILP